MNYDAPRTTSTTPPNTLRTRRPPSRNVDGHSYGAHTTAASPTLQSMIHNPLAPYRPTASPVPSRHPSRASTAIHDSNRATVSRSGRDSQRTSSNSSSNFWDSPWPSFQDLASQLLNGSDASDETLAARPQARKRRPLAATHDRITSAPPAQWGPAGTAGKELGKGSKEDRLAHVQAKKREGLLAANGHVLPDVTGRFKRRDSDELYSGSIPPAETDDRDALVYLHPVKPQDTMAGVMIKYNCEANIFRKANRLWPNDSIQIRKVVMLPVEACGVKGRKLPDAAPTPELLNEAPDEDFMPTPTAHRPPWPFTTQNQHPQETPFSSVPSSPSISVTGPPEDSEPPWKHDSWVTIDGFASAVEIARLPRRTLGFFPRSRRKSPSNSHSHSDIGGSTPPPSSSLDLPRLSLQSTSSPRRGGGNGKSRSSSSAAAAAKHPSPFQLHGPGGVGTLGKDVRGPGPAPDGLNKLFPNVAPRDSSESHRSADDHPSSSSAAAAAAALGIENVGGVIEGWVRKMAWSVVRSPRAVSRTREREAEVFELTDAAGGGEEEEEVDDRRRRKRRGGGG